MNTNPSLATADILSERKRQQEKEGWTTAHDDTHTDGSLAIAAACHAAPAIEMETLYAVDTKTDSVSVSRVPKNWPQSWYPYWWKPRDRRSDLVRSGAENQRVLDEHNREYDRWNTMTEQQWDAAINRSTR